MDEDDFFDTISVNSLASHINRRRQNSKDYISASRPTVYHSVFDLDENNMELAPLGNQTTSSHDNKVFKSNIRDVKTYSQWRDRQWRSFTTGQCVDFVLAYEKNAKTEALVQRETFETNLRNVGLLLEKEEHQRIHFIKIHVPDEVLCQYAELLKLRLPIKDDGEEIISDNIVTSTFKKIMNCCQVSLDPKLFPKRKYQLTAEFRRDKWYLFDMSSPNFFDCSVRITVASYILERERFGEEDQDKGIKRLISEGVYKAAYPLHDGHLEEAGSKRKLLAEEWASISKCIKFQPIDEIKDYFGVKFAIYFTWLGFYTHMLIPAAIVGVCCLIYAATTLNSNRLVDDICTLDITMCPRCDKYCDYWKLNESCTYSKIQHFVDNPATIFFALFMSVWAAIYLELWKRYSAEIAHRWGLTGFDLQAEPPRPEYLIRLANAKKKKLNIVTQLHEPVVPFWRVKLPSIILSFTVALFLLFIAVGLVFGVVLYRMYMATSQAIFQDKSGYGNYFVPVTAGLMNLVSIVILNFLYNKLAIYLTDMELQRTQTEYDESLALKIYMFQFVNYYSCIFYIAFLKGKFVGYPSKHNKILGIRQEECNPGGCLMELTIQLAIIMIGNQAINAIVEIGVPLLLKIYNSIRITAGLKTENEDRDDSNSLITCNQWTEDYKLADMQSSSLFAEYLEMVLQYGFVTIFITAFPLAPLFALINNVLEMRLDAKKFIKYYRRPVPQRVKNIGIWLPILAIIGRISIVSNGFIIAFSSNFIPKLVYTLKVNKLTHDEEGYLDFSLAKFNTSDFPPETAPINSNYNVSICRYADFRNPQDPDPNLNYKRPLIYWHILAARLAFLVIYQNLVTFIVTAVEWIIPDVSRKLNDQIKREVYKTNETIIKYEAEKARQTRDNKRDSIISGSTIYYDANGDMPPGYRSNRSSRYYDADD